MGTLPDRRSTHATVGDARQPLHSAKEGRVAFIGVLPPPVNGMTLATLQIVERLRSLGVTRIYAISHVRHVAGVRWKILKASKVLVSVAKLVQWGWAPDYRLYFVANSGRGLWHNIAQAVVGRLLGYRLYLHHQVASYISKYDWRMGILARVVGGAGVHIVLCDQMRAEFVRMYPIATRFLVAPNPSSTGVSSAQSERSSRFVIGHLSNISIEKGLGILLLTVDALIRDGVECELRLAGPLAGKREEMMISEALAKHGDRIRYLGPLYGAAKNDFYSAVDAFLFPTQYSNEAYPLVLVEALGHGIPIVAYGRCCIPCIIGNDGGVAVGVADDFARAAAAFVKMLVASPDEYAKARDAAARRGKQLQDEARLGQDEIIAELWSGEKAAAELAADVTATP